MSEKSRVAMLAYADASTTMASRGWMDCCYSDFWDVGISLALYGLAHGSHSRSRGSQEGRKEAAGRLKFSLSRQGVHKGVFCL